MLTPKQQRFVDEYLIDLNATRAAKECGYAEATANREGSRLLSNVDIAAAIAERQAQRATETKIDAAYVLKRLHEENEADLADLYDRDTGALLPVHEWPMVWRKGLIQGIDLEEIREEGVVTGFVRKVKISERIKRTELIGRHVNVQAFKEQLEVTVNDRAAQLLRARQRKAADAAPTED